MTNYFQILGIIFGIAAMLKPFYMHLIPWDENKFIKKAYKKKRPKWIIPVAILGIILVLFTWYMELTTKIEFSIIITLLFSLTMVKALMLLFDYEKFQKWVSGMVNHKEGKKIVIVDVFVGLFGLILLLISLILL